jgi:hypothetical protein
MAVSLIWSISNGGAAITPPLNIGTIAPGSTTDTSQIFIRHTGLKAITGCKLYIQPYSGSSFTGIETAQDNFDELTGAIFNPGLQINVDQINEFPASSWKDISSTVGSSNSTALNIGTIPAGDTPGVSFKVRFAPTTLRNGVEDTGRRQFDFRLTFLTTE